MKNTFLPACFALLAAAAAAFAGVAPAKPLRALPAGLEPTRTGSPAAAAEAPKATDGKWIDDFDDALAIASSANLPLFLNFTGSDWCPWCKFADERVFSKKEWREYAAGHLVPVFVDFPNRSPLSKKQKEANDALAKKYGIRGFPTFLILSPDGQKVLGQFGISRDANVDDFIAQIERFTNN